MKHKVVLLVVMLVVVGFCGVFAGDTHYVYLDLFCGEDVDRQEVESILIGEIRSLVDVVLVESRLIADVSFSVIMFANTTAGGDISGYDASVTLHERTPDHLAVATLQGFANSTSTIAITCSEEGVRSRTPISTKSPAALRSFCERLVVGLDGYMNKTVRAKPS